VKTPGSPDIIEQPENPVVINKQKEEKVPVPDNRGVVNKENVIRQPEKDVTVKNIPEQSTITPINSDTIKTAVVKLDNDLPKPVYRITETQEKTVSDPAVEQTNLTKNDYAMQASYIQDAEIKSENYVFYNITAEEFKKSKIGNFLKRVKRTIEKKIPLRNNGLKIGNVEIAKDDQN
jgi:hypothetical protein